MKVVAAWLCMVVLALVVAGSCSIKHSSEQYECETNGDCADLGENRVCSEGLCVVPGGGGGKDASVDASRVDAPPIDGPPLVCPPQCTSCNLEKKECNVDCANDPDPTTCASQITCPAGFSCAIKCNSASSCRMGISCAAATACKIECSGFGSCRNVQCGPGACDVNCSGSQSCGGATSGGISCGQSCACDVTCGTSANCFNVTCTKPQCDIGRGCSSEPATCDTCP